MSTARPEIQARPVAIESASSRMELAKLTLVIPCFNEEAALPYLSKTLVHFFENSVDLFQLNIIFVNDGSTDRTGALLSSLFSDWRDTIIIEHQANRGIAAAIQTGFRHSSSEFVAVIDADCTFDPLQLIDMFPLMEPEIDVVAASPFHQQGRVANVPAWRLLLSRGAAFLYRLVLHHNFSGYTSCFRIYRREAIKDISVYNEGFCGVTEILVRLDLAGHKMRECPAELQSRLLGQSKISLIKTSLDHIRLILRIIGARWLGLPLPVPADRD